MAEEWVEYDGGVVQDRHRSARRIRVASDVAVIPERAFFQCEDLRAVDLSNVTTISAFAFSRCGSLECVFWTTTASAVEIETATISAYAFSHCGALERVVWNTASTVEIRIGAFADCEKLKEIDLSNVTKFGSEAFERCTNLTEVVLGGGIQRVASWAFCGCSSLERISISSSVTCIEVEAFWGCRSLVEVELREGLQIIGESAFQDCTSLLRIDIPSTTVTVGASAFERCEELRHAELREGLQTFGGSAFADCVSLERVAIPSSVTYIGAEAFRGCSILTDIDLSREGPYFIEDGAFKRCPSLEHINVPPVAFVIDDIEDSSCRLMRTTMPKQIGGTLVVSKWMQYRSPDELEQAEAKINEILRHLTIEEEEEKIWCIRIRKWFTYYYLVDVATMLELAIWRVNLDGDEQDAEARRAIRENCGNDMNVIIPCVLPFLEV